MKTQTEIQETHDLLCSILKYDAALPADQRMDLANAASLRKILGVLCWALNDTNAKAFEWYLAGMHDLIRLGGYKLVRTESHAQ